MKAGPLVAALLGVAATLSCRDAAGPTTGAVRVAVTTAGLDLDADGYMVTVDGQVQRPVSPVDAFTIGDLATGAHTVALSRVADNCAVSSDAAPVVMVAAGDTTQVAFAVACAPLSGSVQVTVASEGLDLDPDGFAVTLDGGVEHLLPVNGAVLFSPVLAGDHTVQLRGLAENCAANGALTRNVTVAAGAPGDTIRPTVVVAYTVACTALVGDLRVTTVTTGTDLDSDGYTVRVDGGPPRAVDVNGALVIAELRSGEHSVELGSLAGNCAAAEPNPRAVAVTFGATAGVTFAVTCRAQAGSLRVTVTTTGVDIPDGYDLCIVAACVRVAPNDTVVISPVPVGEHTLALGGVPANCAVTGANPQTVTVVGSDTTDVTVAVVCAALTGSLRVTVSTTGVDVPDGYTVVVDSIPEIGIPEQPWVPANGAIVISGLAPGQHFVFLRPMPANCVVSGPIPRQVLVTAGDTTEVTLEVTCAALPPPIGALRVTTATTGVYFDWDRYGVSVDSLGGGDVPANGALVVSGIPAGDHQVKLRVPSNCDVSGANPRPVSIVPGDTAEVAFGVNCRPTTGILEVTAVTSGAAPDSNGYAIGVDPSCDIYGNDCSYGWSDVVSANGTVRFVVNAGSHTVWLEDVAANCAVPNGISDTLEVAAGDTAKVTFAVVCSDVAGDVRVTTVTTGPDLDPNGYTVRVDDLAWHIAPVNGVVTVPGPWAAGLHTVELSDVAPNCAVSGANPRTVAVTGGDTADVEFAIACSALILTGSVRVITATTGVNLDPDGFNASVDGGPSRAVAVNDTIVFPDLPAGERAVALSGVAANCVVEGTNPRTVTVAAGGTADVAFAVTCTALPIPGAVRVTVATTGAEPDPDGYMVLVQGLCHWVNDGDGGGFGYECDYERTETVGVNGAVTILDVPEGAAVGLGDVARNCTVAGENPRPATADVAFAVTCLETGSVRVTVATTGFDLDPDGYTIREDGVWLYDAPGNGAVTISGFAAGDHTLALEGVAANCVVDGVNPRTVSVAAGGTTEVTFAVTCAALVSVQVTVGTTGSDLDPDGYTVRVDGAWYATYGYVTYATTVNGTVTISRLLAGERTIALEGVAANCVIEGTNPRTVTVAAGGTADVAFAVTCSALGSIQVTAGTAGVDLDPNGFTVSWDGGSRQLTLGTNGTVTISGLNPGGHSVLLGAMAGNCQVSGSNPRTVTVSSGETTPLVFDVTCSAAGQIAFEQPWCYWSWITGDVCGVSVKLWRPLADGLEILNLASGGQPAWSPDGARLAFMAGGDVAVLNIVDETFANLTNDSASDGSPAWSPDGTKIAFATNRDGQGELYAMNPDGSGVTRLTQNVGFTGGPAWSPDGTKIAFDCLGEGANVDICVVNADGTGFVRLTSDPAADFGPAWSPDGTKIAFATERYTPGMSEIAFMNPDGTAVSRAGAGVAGFQPDWSPDGTHIVFSDQHANLYVMNADGSGLVRLASGYNPAWRPGPAL